ncbi:MAG: argininosuccinate lyase, partial [Pseudomonadota bacterium]|nr:argininosuccinate lyase [Pseudomonadota bacterium]
DLIQNIQARPERMLEALNQGFATATDLADYLVMKGVPFRDAHEAVARAVREAEKRNCDLSQLDINLLKSFHQEIEPGVYDILTPQGSIQTRTLKGGTAPATVKQAILTARERLIRRPDQG